MAQLTMNEMMDRVGNALDAIEEADLTSAASVAMAHQEATRILRQLHLELALGYAERNKVARRRDRQRVQDATLLRPLWEDDRGAQD